MKPTKPFDISKQVLWNAYKLVRKNGGGAGIDGMTIEDLDERKGTLLYALWNRMSSGSYFPKPVLRTDIPKKSGGIRSLGIPAIMDRIAQMTARLYLEPILEPLFHPDSYGYRPKKSAHQALAITRKRCWKYDWVVDLDIKGFFDAIDHELLLKAVRFHNPPAWVLLYIERWLKAPAEDAEGKVTERALGTPQGGVISPLLANLYLHYAFDLWMTRTFPHLAFARYADDLVVHCRTREEAESLLEAVKERFAECKLTVHPEKTKIVYCKDDNRMGEYECVEFDFLSFTFRPRHAKNHKGQYFVSFSPAISRIAEKSIRDTIRSWKVHKRTGSSLSSLVKEFNPIIRGWLQYFGAFRRSALRKLCEMFHKALVKWAKNKFRRLKRHWSRAHEYFKRLALREPKLLVYWVWDWCLNG